MVGLAVALRLALLRGSLASGPGSAARRAGLLAGAVAGGVLALVGLLVLATVQGPTLDDTAVLLFTVLLLGWTALPVLTFAGDDLMDPSRLALLPLSGRQLCTLLAVGAVIGVAPVCTLLACLGLVLGAGRDGGPVAAAVALVAAVLQVLLCVSVSRLAAALLSGVLRSRRGRDLGVAVAALLGVSLQGLSPLLQRVSSTGDGGADLLLRLADPVRLLPPGLLATAPGLVRDGRTGTALLRLLLVAGLVVLVLAVWQRSVARSTTTVDRTTGRRRRRRPDRLPRLLPAGRTGAVAAKDLRYVRRDARRTVALLTVVLLPLLIALGPAISGGSVGPGLVFAICGTGLFAGSVGANRFGADGTATWMLVASQQGLRDARRDLAGGDLATALLLVPVLGVGGVALGLVTGGSAYVPAAVGLSLALLGASIGASCLTAVAAPFAVPEQPTSMLNGGGAGVGLRAVVLAFAQLLGVPLLCLPLLALLLPALDRPTPGLILLAVGPVYGLLVGGALRELAARSWLRRGPEVLQVLSSGRG